MRTLSILVALALIAGCSESAADEAANNQKQARPGTKAVRIGPVGLHYDSTRLFVTSVQIDLPPDNDRQVRGMKLIAKDRGPLLNQARCPGQEGNVCTGAAEGGLTLTVLNQPFAEFSAPIRNTRPATMAGKQGVTWQGRFGGTPATFTLLPVEQQTLMMIRQPEGEGAPKAATLDAVIGSLTFGEPPPTKAR